MKWNTDTIPINIINVHLGLDIQPSGIERMAMGERNKPHKKDWIILIDFGRHNRKKSIEKRKFKVANMLVTESSLPMGKLKETRDE